jgi:hypothetical protein
MKVFAPEVNIDYYKEWFGNDNPDFERCTDITGIASEPFKIACIPLFYDNLHLINHNQFDLIICSHVEYWPIDPVKNFLFDHGIKNYLVAMGCIANTDNSSLPPGFIYRPWWSFNIIDQNLRYQPSPEVDNKPYIFDILLGCTRSHRHWVLAKSIEHGIVENSICTYRDCFDRPDMVRNEYLLSTLGKFVVPHPYVSPTMRDEYELNAEIDNSVSNTIPTKIYAQTRYSVITESHHQGNFFFSEKTAKAILDKRLFVAFSEFNYLKNMKELLGFKTFDNIIDESYDATYDVVARFYMAFEQMLKLSKMDYREVQEQTKEIREFNYNRLFELRAEKSAKMREMVYNKIQELRC